MLMDILLPFSRVVVLLYALQLTSSFISMRVVARPSVGASADATLFPTKVMIKDGKVDLR